MPVIDAVQFVVSEWAASGRHERLGQFYVNRYCSAELPRALYYQEDTAKAKEAIACDIRGTKTIL